MPVPRPIKDWPTVTLLQPAASGYDSIGGNGARSRVDPLAVHSTVNYIGYLNLRLVVLPQVRQRYLEIPQRESD
jgi:hypothetical protein